MNYIIKVAALVVIFTLTLVFAVKGNTVYKDNSAIIITVCQAGYSSQDIKTAVVVSKSGKLMDKSYQIIRVRDSEKVYEGIMTEYTINRWTRNEVYYSIDFSDFKQYGSYKIRSNGSESYQFDIAENIWVNYLDEMVGFYRIQRCGIDTNSALPEKGFTNRPDKEVLHKHCHLDDAKIYSENGENKNMVGGWHDAGDNNKYGSNESWVTGALAITYLRNGNADFDFDKNGISDILDEIQWGAMDLINILKATDAGIFDTIDAPNGRQYDWKYPTLDTNGIIGDADDRVGHSRISSPMTYDATMKTAGGLAAASRAFKGKDDKFSDECKRYAIKAYDWAISNSDKRGGWYSISDQKNSKFWADVQLYILTKEVKYKNDVELFLNTINDIEKKGTNYWNLLPISLAEYYNFTDENKEKIKNILKNHLDFWKNGLIEPFGVTSQIYDSAYSNFGINEPNISFAADAFRYYKITGDIVYKEAAQKAVQWTLGVNPFDISWVIGIGKKYPMHPHSRLDADADRNANSTLYLPGFLICGANLRKPDYSNNQSPWYEDLPVCGTNEQWRFNEYSISIQYGLLDLIVSMAYENSF